jgi:hypothetical protein
MFAVGITAAPSAQVASAGQSYVGRLPAASTSGIANTARLSPIDGIQPPAPSSPPDAYPWATEIVLDFVREHQDAALPDLAALRDALLNLFPVASLAFSGYVDHEEGWHRLVLTLSADLPGDEYSRLEDAFYQRAEASEPIARALGHVIVSFA